MQSFLYFAGCTFLALCWRFLWLHNTRDIRDIVVFFSCDAFSWFQYQSAIIPVEWVGMYSLLFYFLRLKKKNLVKFASEAIWVWDLFCACFFLNLIFRPSWVSVGNLCFSRNVPISSRFSICCHTVVQNILL